MLVSLLLNLSFASDLSENQPRDFSVKAVFEETGQADYYEDYKNKDYDKVLASLKRSNPTYAAKFEAKAKEMMSPDMIRQIFGAAALVPDQSQSQSGQDEIDVTRDEEDASNKELFSVSEEFDTLPTPDSKPQITETETAKRETLEEKRTETTPKIENKPSMPPALVRKPALQPKHTPAPVDRTAPVGDADVSRLEALLTEALGRLTGALGRLDALEAERKDLRSQLEKSGSGVDAQHVQDELDPLRSKLQFIESGYTPTDELEDNFAKKEHLKDYAKKEDLANISSSSGISDRQAKALEKYFIPDAGIVQNKYEGNYDAYKAEQWRKFVTKDVRAEENAYKTGLDFLKKQKTALEQTIQNIKGNLAKKVNDGLVVEAQGKLTAANTALSEAKTSHKNADQVLTDLKTAKENMEKLSKIQKAYDFIKTWSEKNGNNQAMSEVDQKEYLEHIKNLFETFGTELAVAKINQNSVKANSIATKANKEEWKKLLNAIKIPAAVVVNEERLKTLEADAKTEGSVANLAAKADAAQTAVTEAQTDLTKAQEDFNIANNKEKLRADLAEAKTKLNALNDRIKTADKFRTQEKYDEAMKVLKPTA